MEIVQSWMAFPPAKVNLGLFVAGKRPDGFHDLASFFVPISGAQGWTDVLELDVLSGRSERGARLQLDGIAIPGASQENLVLRAYHLLDTHFGQTLPDVDFRLTKKIPTGAGLGGGSADGTFALRLLNSALALGLEDNDLLSFAEQLGSDCPFFIQDDPAWVTGRGECIEPLPELFDALKDHHIAVIHPGIHVSTAEAFAGITPRTNAPDVRDCIEKPVEEWATCGLVNDFQAGVTAQHPEIDEALAIVSEGALFASMTGTGSAVYGIFRTAAEAEGVAREGADRGWSAHAGPIAG